MIVRLQLQQKNCVQIDHYNCSYLVDRILRLITN